MELKKQLAVALNAAQSGIRVNTDEVQDVVVTIIEFCNKHHVKLRVWDKARGLSGYEAAAGHEPVTGPAGIAATSKKIALDGLATIKKFTELAPAADVHSQGEHVPVILVMHNLNLCFELCDPATREHLIAACQLLIAKGKSEGKFLIGLMSPDAKLPRELISLFEEIDHELPTIDELVEILERIDGLDATALLTAVERKKIAKFALGLTRLQAENAFAECSQFRTENFGERAAKHVWRKKSKILNREGLVTLYEGTETFDDVVGHQGLKDLITQLLRPDEFDPDNPDIRARGIAVVGPPRTGKSLIAKAAGNTLGLPTLMVDVGRWMGEFVGTTERNTRKGFAIIKAHAPCIAVLDEAEKTLPSAKGSQGDSGVGRRMAGTFMTMLQDIKEPVFWVFTANSIEDMHEALLDDDRVDVKVYVKMPGPEQRAAGWAFYLAKYFPPFINGKAFARCLAQTNVDELLHACSEDSVGKTEDWVERFVAALLCVPLHRRAPVQAKINKFGGPDGELFRLVQEVMFDDVGWTIARIKSVCRMARLRKLSLPKVAAMMPRKQTARDAAIEKLEAWAVEEAIDAETGTAFVSEAARKDDEERANAGSKMRRKVRTIDPPDPEDN